ncbi:hypothetical protein HDU76_013200 [Blyttiomyces sp. JEL0837]|nr:hypothetical protein HDU76_013200 [Blyttiomyces sp. JEL0837]
MIILHSPEEKPINSVDEILEYAVGPGFMIYMLAVITTSLYFIYSLAPVYGRKNLLVYITICSLVGSISVMACKGFGIALKLTFAGSNQLSRPSTYIFGITVAVCAITQMNFLNKALELFSTNIVTPVYYVFFTTATIAASVILFQGIYDATGTQLASVFCGFLTIFIGVYLLNSGKGGQSGGGEGHEGGSGSSNRSGIALKAFTGGGGDGDDDEDDEERAALNTPLREDFD